MKSIRRCPGPAAVLQHRFDVARQRQETAVHRHGAAPAAGYLSHEAATRRMAILGAIKERSTVTTLGVFTIHRMAVPSMATVRRRLLGLAVGGAVTALLPACGGAPKPAPVVTTLLDGSLQAAAGVNPSVSQRPSPLLVRVYELKGATTFSNADFVALFQRDQAELGADIVSREEMMLSPGESVPIKKTLAPETRFIGVFAAYRDLERARWRAVVAVDIGKKNKLLVRADELAISATLSN